MKAWKFQSLADTKEKDRKKTDEIDENKAEEN